MTDLTIQCTERMVGANHPSLSDTLNRLTLVEHNNDGSHNKLTQVKDPYVDVRAYGAVGDGVTNDSVAIQAAIDYCNSINGGTVLFPANHTFICNIVLKNWVTLKGHYNSTYLKPATSAPVIKGDTAGHMVRWGIEGFKIDCLNGQSTGIELFPTQGYWYDVFFIRNIRIENPKYGIYIKSGSPYTADAQFVQQGRFSTIEVTLHPTSINGIYIEGPLLESSFSSTSVRGKGTGSLLYMREASRLNSESGYSRLGRVLFQSCFFDAGAQAGTIALLENVRAVKFDTCYFEQANNAIILRGDKHRTSPETTINDNENINVNNCVFHDQASVPIAPYLVNGLTVEGSTFNYVVGGTHTNAIYCNYASPRTDLVNINIGNGNKYAPEYTKPLSFAASNTLPTGATPSVNGYFEFLTANASPTTIINLTGGITGKVYTLILNEGNTTIQHNVNIKLRGERDFYGATNDAIRLIYDGSIWREVGRVNKYLPSVSADNGDASITATVGPSSTTLRFNTPMTALRTVTLSTTEAQTGDKFRVVRESGATGAFNLEVGTGPLKALTAAGQWCDVEFDGSGWRLVAYGTL